MASRTVTASRRFPGCLALWDVYPLPCSAMARPLVVVESPAKARTIARFLGDEYDVRASVGHVADLPSKGLAVDVNAGFKPTYELTPRGKEVVRDLRSA